MLFQISIERSNARVDIQDLLKADSGATDLKRQNIVANAQD
jgi:hypothetical protein